MSELTAEKIRQQYNYYAFISYSRKDEKWAKWLQTRLETYRLPAAIRKCNVDLPQKISPVFRDKTDLSGIVLEDALHRELEASKYLIVICSPNSAASDYVNKEIAYFASLGREKSIIPFIIDGEPFSPDSKKECFPQALREMESELLGISVSELGKTNAFLRMVSTLLNLKYDQVVMRDTRRRIRRNAILTAAALMLSVLLGITVWYNVPHVKYYNAYIYRNEIPVGIYQLSSAERKTSHDHYRITTQRGKVIKLECVNSAGYSEGPVVSIATYDYPILEFDYNSSGKLISVNQRDLYNQLVSTKVLSYDDSANEIVIDFRVPDRNQAYAMSSDMSYLAIGSIDDGDRSEITRLQNTYNEEGLLIRSMYQKSSLGTPACDGNGVYGKLYEYNEQGQITRISNLNADGEVHNCRYGWAAVEYTYDHNGNYTQEFWYDAGGNRVRSERGISSEKLVYDNHSNMIQWQSLDEDGNLCNSTDGFAMIDYAYDSRGRQLSAKIFDANEMPAYNADGIHEIRCEYDEHNRSCGSFYYDADSKPVYSQSLNCAGVRAELDEAGRTTELWYYGTDGELTCDISSGSYGVRCVYDDSGNMTDLYYLDKQGNLTMTKYGYASWHDTYDASGHPVRTEYGDENGDLVRDKSNIAIMQKAYEDDFGNWTSVRYYDENGDPCYSAYGYAGADYTYENGNMVSERYVDTEGAPMLGPDHYYECLMDYDEKGNCIRYSYYDTAGNLLNLTDNYAIVEKAYDDYGNKIEEIYYDSNMLEVVVADDYYRMTWEYDSRGNVIRESYFTYPYISLSFYSVAFEYDEYDNVIRERYYDQMGNLIRGTDEYTPEFRFAYDAQRNKISEEMLDENGMPMNYDDADAVNVEQYIYDERGKLTQERYLHADKTGNLTCLYQYAYYYDEFGSRIQSDSLDGNGDLIMHDKGFARGLQGYNETGDNIWLEYYDENNKPCTDEDGVFRYEYEYDKAGNKIESRSYGTDGELLREADGLVACIRYEYDAQGNTLSCTYYNENGNWLESDRYYSRVEYVYDAMGYTQEIICYDSQGNVAYQKKPIPYIAAVYAGSMAEEAGILPADYLIQCGAWNCMDETTESTASNLQSAISNAQNTQKEFIVFRIYDYGGYGFLRFQFPEGKIGINIQTANISADDMDLIKYEYEQWLEEGN